jgi:hypothetical protein
MVARKYGSGDKDFGQTGKNRNFYILKIMIKM